MSGETLPTDICNTILQRKFNNPAVQYVKSEMKPISELAEGYMGEHFNLVITYKLNGNSNTAQFFMKRKPTKNKIQEEAAENTGIYKKEIFLYDVLLKEFEKYNYDVSFASKCYYCIPNQAIILENLKLNGYELLERNTIFSLERIKTTLKTLAMFHAAGYAYEKTKSRELNRDFNLLEEYNEFLKETVYIQCIDSDAYVMKLWNNTYSTINILIDHLPKDEAFKQKFKTLFNNYEFGKVFVEETNMKKTIGHGDLWSNNMMFKTEQGQMICKLLDFQIVRYFHPTFDIVLAVYCNTNKEFRTKYLNELLDYYYNTLSTYLTKYSYRVEDFISKQDLHKSFVSVRVDALLQVAETNILICLPKEKLDNAVNDESMMKDMLFGNAETSLEYFKKDEKFRNIVTETLLEVYDAIIAQQNN